VQIGSSSPPSPERGGERHRREHLGGVECARASLSRSDAHETSRESSTSSPWRRKCPRSFANTSGAQSASGTKPIRSRRFSIPPIRTGVRRDANPPIH
jgi:hypothetical protein